MPKTAAHEVRLHQQRKSQPFRKASRGVRQSGLNKPTLEDGKEAAVSCSWKKSYPTHMLCTCWVHVVWNTTHNIYKKII
jgi:hypothetical protein